MPAKPMPPTRREKQYAATSAEIKDTARRLMAEHGTAGVSIRAIARAMGLSAPSLYHYFPNRDELITALISDAFNALADDLEQVRDRTTGTAAERLMAVVLAYRSWALAHPLDFQLIYGNPIPGYVAPREITVPAVVRGFAVLVGLLAEALADAPLGPAPHSRRIPADLEARLAAIAQRDGYAVPVQALYLGIVGWTRMHGIVMLELFNHLQPVVGAGDTIYRLQMQELFESIGLDSDA